VTGGPSSLLTVSYSAAVVSDFAGTVSGNVSLAFNGVAGSAQVLSGTGNSYTGSTAIDSGALIVNGSITNAGTGVTVYGGTLGGNGSINQNVVINAAGTIAPGPSLTPSTDVMNIGSNSGTPSSLSLNGVYAWDLGGLDTTVGHDLQTNGASGASFDQIGLNQGNASAGSLSINSTSSTLDLGYLNSISPTSGDPFWNSQHDWQIVTGSFNTTGGSAFNSILGAGGTWNSGLGELVYSTGYFDIASYGSNQVLLEWNPTAVPEPGTLLLSSLAAMGLGGYGWRKRKNKANGQKTSETSA
jgi:hypothetical protein